MIICLISRSRTSRRCLSRKKVNPKTRGVILPSIKVHDNLLRAHSRFEASLIIMSARRRGSLIEAICRRQTAIKKGKLVVFHFEVGYRRRCTSPSRDRSQCRTNAGVLPVISWFSTWAVALSDETSATHSSRRIFKWSSFGSLDRASMDELHNTISTGLPSV